MLVITRRCVMNSKVMAERGSISREPPAKLLHVSNMTISRIKSGKQDLTGSWLQRLAQVFELSPLVLLHIAVLAEIQNDVEPVAPKAASTRSPRRSPNGTSIFLA